MTFLSSLCVFFCTVNPFLGSQSVMTGEEKSPAKGRFFLQHLGLSGDFQVVCQQVSASKPKSKNCVFSMIGGK